MKRVATKQPGGTWAVDIGATLTCYGLSKESAEDWAQDVEYKIQAFGAVVEALGDAVAKLAEISATCGDRKILEDSVALLARVKKGEGL